VTIIRVFISQNGQKCVGGRGGDFTRGVYSAPRPLTDLKVRKEKEGWKEGREGKGEGGGKEVQDG